MTQMKQHFVKLKEYIYETMMDEEEFDTELDYILKMIEFDIDRDAIPIINELTEYIYNMAEYEFDTELDYMLQMLKFECELLTECKKT